MVVAEYDPIVWDHAKFTAEQRRMTRGLLDCAAKNGLLTVDTFDELAATPNPRQLYGLWHMNEPGNHLIAKLIAEKLKDPSGSAHRWTASLRLAHIHDASAGDRVTLAVRRA